MRTAPFGFLRVAAASPRLRVADPDYNVGEVLGLVQQARSRGVQVLLFPELALTGYTCGDLFFSLSTLIAGAERALGRHTPYFDLEAYRVIVEEQDGSSAPEPVAEATVRVRVKGMLEHTAAGGNGPVDALDHALRKALEEFYPNLREMRLLDYKVRILDESKGTAAKTRVLITSGDGGETWGTVGVADNIIEASWQALVDSIEYKLRRDERAALR